MAVSTGDAAILHTSADTQRRRGRVLDDDVCSGGAIALWRPALAVAAAACGGDLTLPDPSGAGFELDKVSGDGQTGHGRRRAASGRSW